MSEAVILPFQSFGFKILANAKTCSKVRLNGLIYKLPATNVTQNWMPNQTDTQERWMNDAR